MTEDAGVGFYAHDSKLERKNDDLCKTKMNKMNKSDTITVNTGDKRTMSREI